MRRRSRHLIACALVAICLSACGSGLRVTAVQLGRSLNADGTVASHTTTFGRKDTVYLSVVTAGVGSGTMSVRWTYGNQVVSQGTRKVSYHDVAATEFHLQSADGFPLGDYAVEAFLDGQSIGKKTFRIKDS
jgi:hypothetical protein